jgi:A/G-specific adenine glycosylase
MSGAAAWLIRLRPPRGIWGGLWEFPWAEHQAEEESAAALCAAMLTEAGAADVAGAATPMGHVSHGLTHFQLELDCMLLPLDRQRLDGEAIQEPFRWATREELAALPLARLSHKALALLERHHTALAQAQNEPPRLA